MHTRRSFLWTLATAWLWLPSGVFGQQQRKVWRVGFLSARRRPESLDSDYYGAFPRRMGELGYVEGKNLLIEWRFADGDYERLPGMATELAQSKVDVILGLGPPGALAAQKATTTIPIVFVVSSDPIANRLVKSLAKPGGNITGLSNLAGDLSTKHLELLMTIVPKLSRVAIMVNPANSAHAATMANVEAAAQKAGVRIQTVKAQTPRQIESAFAQMASERSGAVIVALDPLFIQQGTQIAEQASKYRLASIFSNRQFAEAGGLMSYGQNQVEIYERAAQYVDKIFKGAKAGDLPVEQPTKLELFINGRTARALGLAVPQSLLLLADKVIE